MDTTPAMAGPVSDVSSEQPTAVRVTFAGCGDAFGSGARFQACMHLDHGSLDVPVLLDCGATSLTAMRQCGLDPGKIAAVFVSHLHGDHFGGLPFLILDGQFSRRSRPLVVAGPAGTRRRLAEAMECMFPGSSQARRQFEVEVVELKPGYPATVAGVRADTFEASHPSGAPALILRLTLGGKVIAYTGDTAWTPAIGQAARDADLLIAEAYYWDKAVAHHLRHADLVEHEHDIAASRTVLTHMSADMLGRLDQARYETAHDGLILWV
jgi:ribonuclease BN (tRNA processing enzyme)